MERVQRDHCHFLEAKDADHFRHLGTTFLAGAVSFFTPRPIAARAFISWQSENTIIETEIAWGKICRGKQDSHWSPIPFF